MAESPTRSLHMGAAADARLRRRYAREFRFKVIAIGALVLTALFLVGLLGSIVSRGWSGFITNEVRLDVHFSEEHVSVEDPGSGNVRLIVIEALQRVIPNATERSDMRALLGLMSNGAFIEIRNMVRDDPSLIGQTVEVWVPVGSDIDMLNKGYVDRDLPEDQRRVDDRTIGYVDLLREAGDMRTVFNRDFFTTGDSREPELAGIGGAVLGSFWMLLVTFLVSFPTGVAAAVFLEEFAPGKKWIDIIEVNINNLAAVPSIVFGLLGLAVFLNVMHLPRSAPVVGGLTLALMTLPTIIITTRAALKGVPPSIREAALGIGASPVQVVSHHVLPLALPRLLTGAIIGMAQALGESAPLLMIGMIAFIVDLPSGPLDAATVLPVQIYLWADSPERGFVEKTSAAIMVLLAFLVVMNGIAVYLRQRFEIRW
ncbi:MAG: phosphate ABC transporter permease PstA [Rhodospirillales bacterium]|nr:phosphate ABC transporter permease PstA [Rhodospirillales bacterium]